MAEIYRMCPSCFSEGIRPAKERCQYCDDAKFDRLRAQNAALLEALRVAHSVLQVLQVKHDSRSARSTAQEIKAAIEAAKETPNAS